MVIKIIAVVLGIVALLLTFRVEWVIEKLFHNENPTIEDKLKIKGVAAIIAVAVFVAVLIFG